MKTDCWRPQLDVTGNDRLAADGLPVGVCLEGSAGSDRKILAIGKALQDEVGFLPRPGVRAKGDGIEFRSHTTKQ